ncbi:diguanylate cyclase with GAF sensor [Caldanaerovirga acetigignens]|uniref:Diguanylate cyclase with GAF sensor n=1 Tax=Caldanaerovirga acetigignens TaxID=447595 RepID=A0A1M7IS83_9FIRM|nr:sensor domain-containing diguanylate cyclase [Caldanaerovirga acetigignens]SHM43535.1 diguanylate cyclase with GAF sensor [Caldanaerovirga acetigignens]
MKAKTYARAVALAGLGILLVMANLYGFPSGWFDIKYITFFFLMLISELFVVQLDNARFSMEFGTVYAAGFIFGLIPAALMKALSAFFSQLYMKWAEESLPKEVDKVFFNVGQYMLSFFGGTIFFMGLKKIGYPEIISLLSGIFAYFFINNILIETYIFLENGRLALRKSFETIMVDFGTYIISVPSGILTVWLYSIHGFNYSIMGFIPYFLLMYVFKMYMSLIATNRELTALYDVAAILNSALNIEEVIKRVFDSAKSIAPWDTICLFLYRKGCLEPVMYEGFTSDLIRDFRIKPGEGITGRALVNKRGEIVSYKKDSRCLKVPGLPAETKSVMSVPLVGNKGIVGALTLTSNRKNAYSAKNLKIMSILANQAAVAISNARLFDKTSHLAATDGLTGLYNHRYIYHQLDQMASRVRTCGGTFSLILIDIDHFKSYNDSYGHLMGDKVLRKLAQIIKQNVRNGDIVGRYGGEEFAIILPDTPGSEACAIAERIRKAVENTEFAVTEEGKKIFVTVSAGVASCPDDALTVKELVNKADQALLFGAKKKGRNRVVEFKRL